MYILCSFRSRFSKMSASTFFRNFLALPHMTLEENSHHPSRGKGNSNKDPLIQKIRDAQQYAAFKREQEEQVAVPRIDVTFPDSIEKHDNNCLLETTMPETAPDVKHEERLPTASQKADSSVRDNDVDLIVDQVCNAQQENHHFGSIDLKPLALNGEDHEDGTFEATAGEHKLISTQSSSNTSSEDAQITCHSLPPFATEDKEFLTFLSIQPQSLSDVLNGTISVEFFSQSKIEIDTCSEYDRTCENTNSSTIGCVQTDVEPSIATPEEAKDFSNETSNDAASAYDDECMSMSSTNTETYDDTEYQNIEMDEKESKEAIIKAAANGVSTSVDVSFELPGCNKLNENSTTEERTPQDIVASSNNFAALVETLKDHPATQNGSTTATTGSKLGSTSNGLLDASESLCDYFCNSNNVSVNNTASQSQVEIAWRSQFLNATKGKPNQGHAKANSSISVNGRRISAATGVVYVDDDVPCPESSHSTTTTQTLLSSDHSKVSIEFPSASHPSAYDNGKSSSFCNDASSMVSVKFPSNAILVSDRGVAQSVQFLVNSTNTDPDRLVRSDRYRNKSALKYRRPIAGEFQINSSMKTRSSQSRAKDFQSEVESGKQSPGATPVCNPGVLNTTDGEKPSTSSVLGKDEDKSPDISQSSTSTKPSISSDRPKSAVALPQSFSYRANSYRDPSLACFKQSMASTKLPPGSILISDRGLFRIKDKERPFACGYCAKPYKEKRGVYSHIRAKHDVKRYSCKICGKAYAEPCHLAQHTTVHTKEKPFACDQCDKRFRLKGQLRNHRYTHSEERQFQCKICGQLYKTRKDASTHMRRHDKDQEKFRFQCNECGRKFRKPHDLKDHLMIHTGERPFSCSLCDKKFRIKTNLKSHHMRVHLGKKILEKLQCPVCGKSVSYTYMPTHQRMHTGEKPFECNICGKTFPKKINLEGHMRSVHTGEKPFACSGCDKRFALYSNMVTHKTKCTVI